MYFILLLRTIPLILSKAASDCSIIHNASPAVFNLKCCNVVLYGIQCSSSRVVKIDDSEFRFTTTDVHYTDLFPILGFLTELIEINLNTFPQFVSLPPDIGKLTKLKILSLTGIEGWQFLSGSELPPSLSNCIQLQILEVFHVNSGVWEVLVWKVPYRL